jgi:hypothetical protein
MEEFEFVEKHPKVEARCHSSSFMPFSRHFPQLDLSVCSEEKQAAYMTAQTVPAIPHNNYLDQIQSCTVAPLYDNLSAKRHELKKKNTSPS